MIKHIVMFRLKETAEGRNKEAILLVVRLEGFEPPTCGFVVRHSIQLSYRRTLGIFIEVYGHFHRN